MQKYSKENGFDNIKFYIDDGYTGTNFNRPGFKKLQEDNIIFDTRQGVSIEYITDPEKRHKK